MDTEGELNIKMKYILKFLFFQTIILIIFTGCSEDSIKVTEAKILVGDGPGMDDCLMNINEDGTVEYISFERGCFNFHTKEIDGEIYEKKIIRLSKKNKTIINELIQNMIAGNNKEVINGCDFISIYGFVADKVYNSVYYKSNLNWFYDENLAKLCYKLVELAPLKVGGKYAPLEVPPDEYR